MSHSWGFLFCFVFFCFEVYGTVNIESAAHYGTPGYSVVALYCGDHSVWNQQDLPLREPQKFTDDVGLGWANSTSGSGPR